MDKADFAYDHDDFRKMLSKGKRGFDLAASKIAQNVEHWQELQEEYFKNQLSISTSDDKKTISGNILGKNFRMNLLPHVSDEGGDALVILSVKDVVSEKYSEIDRYLFAVTGDILSSDRELLLGWDHDYQSFKHLISVARRVLAHGQ